MGARKPKPTALKEQTSVRPQLGLSRLFAAANALIPFHKHEDEAEEPQHLKLAPQNTVTTPISDKTLHFELTRVQEAAKDTIFKPETKRKKHPVGEESGYGTAVVIPNAPKQRPIQDSDTATMRMPNPNTQPIAATTSVTKLEKKNEEKQSEQKRRLAFLFSIPALALVGYGFMSPDASVTSQRQSPRKSALTQDQINERLEFYRHQTGSKLNRDRINVQIQNFKSAPDLEGTDHKIKAPNMMDGVPLQGEAYKNPTPKDLPYDPTFSDAKIAYGLQEEQDRQYFEKQAREQWIRDFIENARRDGYDLKIDAYGNVTTKKIPDDEREPVN